jgi:hypothetical protein
MYRVDGSSDLTEESLDHFEGWRGSRPVRGDEGTFTLCTFWYVDALARAGRLSDARLTFEEMHTIDLDYQLDHDTTTSRLDLLRG